MTWYADLSRHTMTESGPHVRAVGWLHPDHLYPRGTPPAVFVEQLDMLVRTASASMKDLDWPYFLGIHQCEFCGEVSGYCNFGVPAGDLLYVAPEMILHYVTAHGYLPPRPFVDASMRAPFPRSEEYRSRVEPYRRRRAEALERYHRAREEEALEATRREAERQEQIRAAGRWAFVRGGRDEMIAEAAVRFFGHTLPDLCDAIRRGMPRP